MWELRVKNWIRRLREWIFGGGRMPTQIVHLNEQEYSVITTDLEVADRLRKTYAYERFESHVADSQTREVVFKYDKVPLRQVEKYLGLRMPRPGR